MTNRANLRSGKRIHTHQNASQEELDLKAGRRIELDEKQIDTDENEAIPNNSEVNITPVFTLNKHRLGLKSLFFIALFILLITESVLTITEAINQSWFLGSIYICVLGLSGIFLLKLLVSEYRALKVLKKLQTTQTDALRLMQSVQIGEAVNWLKPILKNHSSKDVEDFKSSISEHHSDKEILALYQKTLLKTKDDEAIHLINQYAATSAVLISLSPMALLDMITVLFRGVNLVETLSQHYKIKLGYKSRISLYKLLIKQMIFVGATELISDFATTALGAELLGKLSTRAAQGLSAGIYTARIGYKAMALCRPIPNLQSQNTFIQHTITHIFTALNKRQEK